MNFASTKDSDMNIIITGSLGHISMPLVQELVQKRHTVTVVSSQLQRQSGIEALGAKAAIGSIEDVSFLTKTLKTADAAYLMTPPDFSEPDQVVYYERVAHAYASAIRQSGIKRVLYLSSYGADLSSGTGFITGSHRAEKILNDISGISLTHIRPTFFYYNLFAFIPLIKAAGFIGAVYGGEDRLAMVSPRDIALVIAEEIIRSNSASGIRYVASDDGTCTEIARVLGAAIGRPDLQWNALPPEKVLQSLMENGVPANAAENLVELGGAIHNGSLRQDLDQHTPVFGQVSLNEFAREFAAVYNQEK